MPSPVSEVHLPRERELPAETSIVRLSLKGSLALSIVGGEGPYEVCDHLRVEYTRPGFEDLVQAFFFQVSPSVLVLVVVVIIIIVIIIIVVVIVVVDTDVVDNVDHSGEGGSEEAQKAEYVERVGLAVCVVCPSRRRSGMRF